MLMTLVECVVQPFDDRFDNFTTVLLVFGISINIVHMLSI